MFILRRNKDNDIVCEQAACPTPLQIVKATAADMTWRCNAHSETIPFMDATSAALRLMQAEHPKQHIYLEMKGKLIPITIPADMAITNTIVRYCGMYFQHLHGSWYNSLPRFTEVDLYDASID